MPATAACGSFNPKPQMPAGHCHIQRGPGLKPRGLSACCLHGRATQTRRVEKTVQTQFSALMAIIDRGGELSKPVVQWYEPQSRKTDVLKAILISLVP